MTSRTGDDRWDGYLAAFHADRPGITEAVLDRARLDDGRDPYDWLADALPSDSDGVVADVACGSGPLATRAPGRWIGLDLSRAELDLAAPVAPGRVVVADAGSMPLRTAGLDAVACAMALMLLPDPGPTLAEMARPLRVGGRLVALVPATGPLTATDRLRYLRLLAALRLRRLPFRHHGVLDEPEPLLARAGLTLVGTERRRFAYPLTSDDDGPLFLRSLYLPDLAPRRLRAAHRVTRRWTGSTIGIPLQRLVATRHR